MKLTQKEAMPKLTVRLPDKLLEELQVRAARERRTLQDVVNDAITVYLRSPLRRKEDKR
jgi:plasmid stability protein